MADILVQKDANNLIPKIGITLAERSAWAQDFTVYDINLDGTKGPAFGPLRMAKAARGVLSSGQAQAVAGQGAQSMLVIGDSWGARHYSTGATALAYADVGAATWAQALSGQRLDIVRPEAALGGTTSFDWVDTTARPGRLATYLTNYRPGIVLCFLGINDISGDLTLGNVNTPNTTIYNLNLIYEQCLAAGAKLIICNVGPYGSTYVPVGASLATKTAQRDLLNDWIAFFVATHSNCWLVDQFSTLVSPSDTSGFMAAADSETTGTTGLHTTASGSRKSGAKIAAIITSILGDPHFHASSYTNSYDYDTNSKNRLSNPLMLSSGGGTSVGGTGTITGTIAASWTVATSAGSTGSVVCSTPARTVANDGDTIGNNQRMVISGAVANDVMSLRCGSISSRFALGDVVEAEMYVRVSSATNLWGVRLVMQSVQGGTTYTSTGMSYATSGQSYDSSDSLLVIKTPPLVIGPGALTGHILSLDVRFAGAGGATIDGARGSWRKLN